MWPRTTRIRAPPLDFVVNQTPSRFCRRCCTMVVLITLNSHFYKAPGMGLHRALNFKGCGQCLPCRFFGEPIQIGNGWTWWLNQPLVASIHQLDLAKEAVLHTHRKITRNQITPPKKSLMEGSLAWPSWKRIASEPDAN